MRHQTIDNNFFKQIFVDRKQGARRRNYMKIS